MITCSTSIRPHTCRIEEIATFNCNDQIAAKAFGATEHVNPSDFKRLNQYDVVFATMWKVETPAIESRWMDVLHRLKDETDTKVILFQEAETPWPTRRSWAEQKSFIELLGKVDLFLTHNQRDVEMWGQLRKGKPSYRWRTCLDLEQMGRFTVVPGFKVTQPVLFGSSYDERANGLAGLIACKDLGHPLWHQNRSTGYLDRNAEMPELIGVTVEKEIPHSGWWDWLRAVSGAYIAVHPMPAASAGRDQICFAAMGIPCIGSMDLDIQNELFPRLAVECFDVPAMTRMARKLLTNEEEYMRVRSYAMERVKNYGLEAAAMQVFHIKRQLGWD